MHRLNALICMLLAEQSRDKRYSLIVCAELTHTFGPENVNRGWVHFVSHDQLSEAQGFLNGGLRLQLLIEVLTPQARPGQQASLHRA